MNGQKDGQTYTKRHRDERTDGWIDKHKDRQTKQIDR